MVFHFRNVNPAPIQKKEMMSLINFYEEIPENNSYYPVYRTMFIKIYCIRVIEVTEATEDTPHLLYFYEKFIARSSYKNSEFDVR